MKEKKTPLTCMMARKEGWQSGACVSQKITTKQLLRRIRDKWGLWPKFHQFSLLLLWKRFWHSICLQQCYHVWSCWTQEYIWNNQWQSQKEWCASAKSEFKSFLSCNSWEIVSQEDVKRSRKTNISTKCVFKLKTEQDGLKRYKSCIVLKGYMQMPKVN